MFIWIQNYKALTLLEGYLDKICFDSGLQVQLCQFVSIFYLEETILVSEKYKSSSAKLSFARKRCTHTKCFLYPQNHLIYFFYLPTSIVVKSVLSMEEKNFA